MLKSDWIGPECAFAEGNSHIGTPKLNVSTTRIVGDAVKEMFRMPVACCHTIQALHPPDSDLTPRMQAARPWVAASPISQAAGIHGQSGAA